MQRRKDAARRSSQTRRHLAAKEDSQTAMVSSDSTLSQQYDLPTWERPDGEETRTLSRQASLRGMVPKQYSQSSISSQARDPVVSRQYSQSSLLSSQQQDRPPVPGQYHQSSPREPVRRQYSQSSMPAHAREPVSRQYSQNSLSHAREPVPRHYSQNSLPQQQQPHIREPVPRQYGHQQQSSLLHVQEPSHGVL